mmetsp:Transcript_8720/g.11391  ORF Transcript_8720/g.11391 Transcript_8720/m.11391 type:complete len:421 (-) Transcript_8720:1485-2747(-)
MDIQMETENDRNASNVNIEVDGPVEKFKQNQRNTKAKEPLTLRSPFVHVEDADDNENVLSLSQDVAIDSWYEQTFQQELSVISSIQTSKEKDLQLHVFIKESPFGVSDTWGEDVDMEKSHEDIVSLEKALKEAQDIAEQRERDFKALENRLHALENLSNLKDVLEDTIKASASSHKHNDNIAIEKRFPGSVKKPKQKRKNCRRRKTLNYQPGLKQPLWDDDSLHPSCFMCVEPFTLLRRRHHCRRCGKVFCSTCAPRYNSDTIPEIGYNFPVRHCIACLPVGGGSTSSREIRSNSEADIEHKSTLSEHSYEFEGKGGQLDKANTTESESDSSLALLCTLNEIREKEKEILLNHNPAPNEVLEVLLLYRNACGEYTQYLSILFNSMCCFYELPQIQKSIKKNPEKDEKAKSLLDGIAVQVM